MKIMFKEDSTELNDLLGFVDADIRINKLKSEILTATKEVVSFIGLDVYNAVLKLYEATTDVESQKELIYRLQYPIAINAWRNFIPSADISHTKNGRKIRNSDQETTAWEWMINKDDIALEKRYYKAMDLLLDCLDEQNPTITAAVDLLPEVRWKNTDAFKRSHKLFVRTTKDFEEFFAIDSRLLLIKLQPGLNQCERIISKRIGAERFDLLKAEMLKAVPDLDENLLALIKEACVYYSLAWAIPRLSVSLLPDGILQKYTGERVNTKNTKVPELLEAERAAQAFTQDANNALQQLEYYLKEPATLEEIKEGNIYPDFNSDCDEQFIST